MSDESVNPHNRGQEWTARELRLLERHYGRIPRREVRARYLPARTIKGIEHRAGLLGLTRRLSKPPQHWTPDEIKLLRQHYGRMSRAELSVRHLPQRSIEQISSKACALGLQRKLGPLTPWNEADIELLRKHYRTMTGVELRRRLFPRRSIGAIRHLARRLGLRSKAPDWSAAEDELIKRYYGRLPNPELAARFLSDRDGDAVQSRAKKLGLTRPAYGVWSARELELLRRHYPAHTAREIARLLPGRSVAAIRTRIRLESAQKAKQAEPWTAPELRLIRRLYESKNGLQLLLRKLDRTQLAIQQQARKLGLSRAGNPWTAEDDALLRELYPRLGRKSVIPGHPPGSVRERAWKLGLLESARPAD